MVGGLLVLLGILSLWEGWRLHALSAFVEKEVQGYTDMAAKIGIRR